MQKKVLHLIDSSGYYGAENMIMALCKSILNTDYYPILGCFMNRNTSLPKIGSIAKQNKIEVIEIPQLVKFDWWTLKKIINNYNIDIIHSHGYKPTVLSYIAEGFSGRRIVITCHLWTNATLRLKAYAFLESLVMRRVHKVIAVSQAIKSVIERSGIDSTKVDVIFNGIDIQEWQRDEELDISQYKKQIGLQENTKILGIFGRLYAQKGHKYLLSALSRIKTERIELIIVGDGPLKSELQHLAQQLGVRDITHFLGFRHDVKNLLQISDFFLMPSLDEGLPIALLEAMSMRKAVVATPVGAIPSVIDDRHDGLFVPCRSVEDLADAIINLTKNPEMAESIGWNARNKVAQNFSSEVMTASYLEIYKGMVKNELPCH